MSEISETEIKAMTKEQNYIRGYKDGKSDVLDKIMKEIKEIYADIDDVCIKNGLNLARRIINKYTVEREDKE